LADSLKLAQAQYKDIHLREKAGASSRIDTLASHQEVLNRRRQLRQAQADLANALGALFTITGSSPPAEISVPMEESAAAAMPAETERPTLLVSLDPLSQSATMLAAAAQRKFDGSHPQIKSLADLVDAAERNAKSVGAGHYPFLQIYGRTTRDYPNGPVLESINQNTVGLTAGISLFEFGRVKHDVAEQEKIAEATRQRKEQTMEDLERDWQKAHDQWLGLLAQQAIFSQSISETEKLQKLTYESYRAGSSTFLEVQSANLRVLEINVASAQNDAQLLIQLAILDSLSMQPFDSAQGKE
jgi:outer membrane protein TolC